MKLVFNGLTSSPNQYDEWFEEERGTGIDYDMEDDVDSTEEDSYDDAESF